MHTCVEYNHTTVASMCQHWIIPTISLPKFCTISCLANMILRRSRSGSHSWLEANKFSSTLPVTHALANQSHSPWLKLFNPHMISHSSPFTHFWLPRTPLILSHWLAPQWLSLTHHPHSILSPDLVSGLTRHNHSITFCLPAPLVNPSHHVLECSFN